MEKYRTPDTTRPKGFFPRLDIITVYALAIESMTGKETLLPPLSEQWPAVDQTRTPHAVPPTCFCCRVRAALQAVPAPVAN